MIRKLTGNPFSIPTALGDTSHPYDSSWKEDYEKAVQDPELGADVEKIIKACELCRYLVGPDVAYYAWIQTSVEESAHWLILPDDPFTIFDQVRRFLIVDESKGE